MKRWMKRSLALLLAMLTAVGCVAGGGYDLQAAAAVWETESNNTYSTANPLDGGVVMTAKIESSGDVDFFKVTPSQNGKLIFYFEHDYYEDSANGWDISFYHKNTDGTYSGGTVDSFSVVRESAEKRSCIPISVVAGVTYLIRVSEHYYNGNSRRTTAQYAVSYSFTPTEYYEREYNGGYDSANSLSASGAIEGNIGIKGDVDYYKFTPSQNGKLKFIFGHSYANDGNNGWDLTVHMRNNDGTISKVDSDTVAIVRSASETWTLEIIGAKAGTLYLIRVAEHYYNGNSRWTSAQYTVSYDFSPTEYYEREFNNGFGTANSLPSGIDYSGNLIYSGDEDWYTFTPTETKEIDLHFKHSYLSADSGWNIRIYHIANDGTLTQDKSVDVLIKHAEDVTVPFNVTSGMVYYIKVSAYFYNGNNRYAYEGYSLNCAYKGAVTNYTLTYSANGGVGAPASQTGNGSVTLSATRPTRDGYTFLGWSTSSSATAAQYAPGGTFILAANTTLFAVWQYNAPSTYTLTYSANGGTGAPASQTGNGSVTLSTTRPTRDGYTFLGWSTSSSATAAQYAPGAAFNLTANTTLYAVWQYDAPTTYTLTYDANGGTGAPASQTGSGYITLSETRPTRDGYTFLGWTTNSSATTAQYAPGSTINLTANTTMYAVWKYNAPTTYTLTYSANGGTGAPANQTGNGSITISTTRPTRDGYTFLGWSTSSSATAAQYAPGAAFNLTANTTLYAVWQYDAPTTYTLTYDANGGTGAPASQTGSGYITLSETRPTRDGYMFLGWTTNSSATTAQYAPGSTINLTANTTMYAVWKYNAPTTYTLTYSANGGTGAPANQTGNGSITISTTRPTRAGYTFLGWSTSSSATTAQYAPGAAFNLTANTTLYAVWQYNAPTMYTLTYNANGGTGAPASQTGNGSITISTTRPTRASYTFLGWSTSSSATTAQYTPGSTINLTANTTLYAVWQYNAPSTYTLYYNANGGTGAPASQTGSGYITLSASRPTRDGYTFLGWSTSIGATTAQYAPGGTFYLNAHTTLYAVWQGTEPIGTPTVQIHNFVQRRTERFFTSVCFTAVPENMPSDASVRWFIDDHSVAEGMRYTEFGATRSYTVQVKIVRNDTVLAESEKETVEIRITPFWLIIGLFRMILRQPWYVEQ